MHARRQMGPLLDLGFRGLGLELKGLGFRGPLLDLGRPVKFRA